MSRSKINLPIKKILYEFGMQIVGVMTMRAQNGNVTIREKENIRFDGYGFKEYVEILFSIGESDDKNCKLTVNAGRVPMPCNPPYRSLDFDPISINPPAVYFLFSD